MKTSWKERAKAIAGLLVLLTLVAPIAAVIFVGVTLTVRNESKSVIDRVTVDYERGLAEVGTLRPGEEWSDDLGKIGEGAAFFISFRQGRAKFQENFNVYFLSPGFRNRIVLRVLDDQQVRVAEEGYERRARQKKAIRMSDAP